MSQGWIGVDFDGTIAEYHGWKGELTFGKPIPKMVERVKFALEIGYDVKIFTARVSIEDEAGKKEVVAAIKRWLVEKAGLPELEVTNVKDFHMVELWDDRAVQVKPNTGRFIGRSTRGFE